MSKAILVTGATGNQGGAVINAILELPNSSDFTILAVTRNASSGSAQKLASKSPSIKLVEGNMDDVPALFESAAKVLGADKKIWGVYSVQISMGKGITHEGEIHQGKAMIDEAVKAAVQHFAYSSVDRGGNEKSWTVETPIPHFISKYHIEHYLKDNAGSMGWTIIRPVAFMDNWAPAFPSRVFMTALENNLPKDKPLQWIAAKDIGIFVAKSFEKPEEYNKKAISIAGDELTMPQFEAAFKKSTSAPISPTFSLLGSALTTAVKEMGIMIRWFGSDGYGADIAECKRHVPSLLDFETWVKQESKFPSK